jgi:hypothetical protein
MQKKITIYEARLNQKYSSNQIDRGAGVTEIEAITELRESAKKWDLSLDDLQKKYAIVEKIDITNEINKYKKKADKILDRLQEILNMIPKYDNSIHVSRHPNCVNENKARIVVDHNMYQMREEINENYKKIFNENTSKGIFKFRQLVSHIHENFFIRYNNRQFYSHLKCPRNELKEVSRYQFVNPFNVSEHDMISMNCRYFGNLDQDFCVDFNLKYANEILASSFSTRDYQKKWEYDKNGEIIGGGYQE